MPQDTLIRDLTTRSPEQTHAIAQRIGAAAQPGDCVALVGDLGAGKTVVAKGIADGLGIASKDVTSPTFVLMMRHEGRLPLYHFDAYRLSESAELLAIGAEEAFYGDGISVIEWAGRVDDILPDDRLEIRLSVRGEKERRMELCSTGPQSRWLLRAAAR
jgi:tRNA threonylcarbamoyladenosine biosynthesis protein TsaE